MKIITANLDDEFNNARNGASNPAWQSREELRHRSQTQKKVVNQFRTASGNPYISGGSGGDIQGIAPDYHIPQLENSSLELPRYRQQIINWCDFYYQTNELVGTAIDIHATLSIADFSISCDDIGVQREYEEILEKLDIFELLAEISQEYFRIGNVFPMGKWNATDATWDEFVTIPALLIELRKNPLAKDPFIFLQPNENVRKVMSDPLLREEMSGMSNEIREKLTTNKPVRLAPERISHISTKSIAGTLWGVPPIYRCFKTLVYADKLYRAQEAIADGHITPLRIISLTTPDGLPVPEEEVGAFRDQLTEASYDPNFILLASGQVKDSYIGSSGRILPLNNEMAMIEGKICSGMKVNKALLHGEGPTYSNAQVYQTAMNYYYLHFRNRLRSWLLNKVFKPIAEARGYYQKENSYIQSNIQIDTDKKKLILPQIIWSGIGNVDSQTVNIIKDLWSNKKISTATYMSMVIPDVDPDTEKIKVLREAEEAIVKQRLIPEIQQDLEKIYSDKPQEGGADGGDAVSKAKSSRPQDSPNKVVKHSRRKAGELKPLSYAQAWEEVKARRSEEELTQIRAWISSPHVVAEDEKKTQAS